MLTVTYRVNYFKTKWISFKQNIFNPKKKTFCFWISYTNPFRLLVYNYNFVACISPWKKVVWTQNELIIWICNNDVKNVNLGFQDPGFILVLRPGARPGFPRLGLWPVGLRSRLWPRFLGLRPRSSGPGAGSWFPWVGSWSPWSRSRPRGSWSTSGTRPWTWWSRVFLDELDPTAVDLLPLVLPVHTLQVVWRFELDQSFVPSSLNKIFRF